jgi:phosphocarrier protein HPr
MRHSSVCIARMGGELSDANGQVVRDVEVPNPQGLHARPVMRFVDVASRFKATILVANVSGRAEPVDGKSAMQMMLLEATQGSVLRIDARGDDAEAAVAALAAVVQAGFGEMPPLVDGDKPDG